MRDLYLGNMPVVDITSLDVGRFNTSAIRPELNIV
jgi:hypothetical protein